MTEAEKLAYAKAQRDAVRPLRCLPDHRACWVTHGGKDYLVAHAATKAPVCAACEGKLRTERWRPPSELHVPRDLRSTKAQD